MCNNFCSCSLFQYVNLMSICNVCWASLFLEDGPRPKGGWRILLFKEKVVGFLMEEHKEKYQQIYREGKKL